MSNSNLIISVKPHTNLEQQFDTVYIKIIVFRSSQLFGERYFNKYGGQAEDNSAETIGNTKKKSVSTFNSQVQRM